MAKSELHRDYILELESELQEFEKKADSLTSDVKKMANTFDHMSTSIERNMESMTGNIGHITPILGQ